MNHFRYPAMTALTALTHALAGCGGGGDRGRAIGVYATTRGSYKLRFFEGRSPAP